MSIEYTTVSIRGKSPLLMHNGSLANPTNPIVKAMKAITGNRKKTDEQYEQLARLEFRGGLYLNQAGKVIVPSAVIEGSIRDGAKKSKLGKQFASAVMVNDDALLDYGEDLTPDEMFERGDFVSMMAVRVEKNRIMRTRPIFHNWRLSFEVTWDSEQINASNLRKAIEDAGNMVGICDYRPKFGRFEIEE